MSRRVVIIGGGFSGLAAGVRLAERGYRVVLLERRPHLGGRAYSFIDSQTNDSVDNGQHLFMGCYRSTIAFLEKIGSLDRLKFQERTRVDFLDRSNRFSRFECPPLPAPLHVVAALFNMKGITFGDRVRALNVGRAIKKASADNRQTVDRWLDDLRQSQRMRERFWYPMIIATLNESPGVASAHLLHKVLQEAFSGDRRNSSIGISSVGLSDLYTTGARAFIESRGGEVRTRAQVCSIETRGERVAAVHLSDGEKVTGDYFISSLPPQALSELLPEGLKAGEFNQLGSLGSSPIISINLWFDRPTVDREFVGLIGTRVQWIFNKDLIQRNGKVSNQIAVIISAAREFVGWSKSALVELALTEMRDLFPASREAALLYSVVVKEPDATLAHTVESDSLRPGARTSIPNFILAGDWIATGLPATIESAVISGNNAAEIIFESL